jgi:hypothetical protein
VIQAPSTVLLPVSTALWARDGATYRRLRRYAWRRARRPHRLHALVALTPLYDLVLDRAMGLPPEVSAAGRCRADRHAPWSSGPGYRRFLQGVMIRVRPLVGGHLGAARAAGDRRGGARRRRAPSICCRARSSRRCAIIVGGAGRDGLHAGARGALPCAAACDPDGEPSPPFTFGRFFALLRAAGGDDAAHDLRADARDDRLPGPHAFAARVAGRLAGAVRVPDDAGRARVRVHRGRDQPPAPPGAGRSCGASRSGSSWAPDARAAPRRAHAARAPLVRPRRWACPSPGRARASPPSSAPRRCRRCASRSVGTRGRSSRRAHPRHHGVGGRVPGRGGAGAGVGAAWGGTPGVYVGVAALTSAMAAQTAWLALWARPVLRRRERATGALGTEP